MAEPFLNHLDGSPLFEHQRSVSVAQIVESDILVIRRCKDEAEEHNVVFQLDDKTTYIRKMMDKVLTS